MAGHASSYAALIESIVPKGSYVPCPKITFLVDKPEDLVCEICLVSKLKFSHDKSSKYTDNTPAMLPCGHVAGYCCLREWLKENHSCPFCRLDLNHELCDHYVKARPIYRGNIHELPQTIPEGGRIASQCRGCRRQTSANCTLLLCEGRADRFREARGKFLESRNPADLAEVLIRKASLENAYAQIFADKNVGGQAVEW